jgi:hypothetical protein
MLLCTGTSVVLIGVSVSVCMGDFHVSVLHVEVLVSILGTIPESRYSVQVDVGTW